MRCYRDGAMRSSKRDRAPARRRKARGRLSSRDFAFIFQRVPRLCVDVVIRDRRGVVLIKRDITPDRGKWHLPGGTVRFGEHLASAVKRFARDETGLEVAVLRGLGVNEAFRRGKTPHNVMATFLVRPRGGTLGGSWQGQRVRFFRSLPQNVVREQAALLRAHRLIA